MQVVALDRAPYTAAVRAALPHARIAVDHFHLVKVASDAVTTVRRRVALEVHGLCGRKSDPRGRTGAGCRAPGETLPAVVRGDVERHHRRRPTGQLLADWIAEELLRELLACARLLPAAPRSARLFRFHDWCAPRRPREHHLAQTIGRWPPELLVFLETKITNAGTEAPAG